MSFSRKGQAAIAIIIVVAPSLLRALVDTSARAPSLLPTLIEAALILIPILPIVVSIISPVMLRTSEHPPLPPPPPSSSQNVFLPLSPDKQAPTPPSTLPAPPFLLRSRLFVRGALLRSFLLHPLFTVAFMIISGVIIILIIQVEPVDDPPIAHQGTSGPGRNANIGGGGTIA